MRDLKLCFYYPTTKVIVSEEICNLLKPAWNVAEASGWHYFYFLNLILIESNLSTNGLIVKIALESA